VSKLMLNPEFNLYERSGQAFCSSRQVAEEFEKRHDNVLQDLRNLDCSNRFRLLNFQESTYKNEQGKKQPEFLMTKDGFVFMVMGYRGKKASQFKEVYISRFNDMETFIKNLLEAKSDFPEFTQAIMDQHEEPKHYHFSNELDMINRIVLGMSTKQFKETHNLGKVPSIRPYLKPNQAESIKNLQRIDIGLILAIPDFQQRKQMLTTQFNRKLNLSLPITAQSN